MKEARQPTPRPHRHRRRLLLGALLLLALGLGALSLFPALAIRSQFEQGRDQLTRAQASLLAGDLHGAAVAFAGARRSFRDAGSHPGSFLLRLEGDLPFIGRTPDALLALAGIGEGVSAAGEEVSRELAALPGGLSSLGLRDGRIPIEELQSLAPAVRRARVALDSIQAQADRLPDSWLLGPVADARDLVRSRLAEAVPLARSADALLRSLPSFAGAEAPRRYFVAVQNSAEVRGTGGLIGNYSILTIDRGRLSLGPFRDTQTLPNLPADAATSPSPEFDALYGPFGGGGFWLNINMTPDAPTAATLIEELYRRVRGESVDGTILFDLGGLQEMVKATGPVTIEALGATVDAENVLAYVATAAYLGSGIENPFSRGPRLIADAVWSRFLGGVDPEMALRSLVTMASRGHLVLHAADPKLQAAFRSARIAGEFGAGEDDFFGLVLNNAAANKVDFYMRERVTYQVALGPGGTAETIATVRLANQAPAGSEPNYPLGPSQAAVESGLDLVPGENRSWIALYCRAPCRLDSARMDASELLLEEHREKDLAVFAGFIQIEPQEERELRLALDRERAWEGDRTGGLYRLRVQGQPLVVPGRINVAIEAPEGMDIVWTSVPMDVNGRRASWAGQLAPGDELAVRFTRPLPARVWTRIWDFLSKPVIRL